MQIKGPAKKILRWVNKCFKISPHLELQVDSQPLFHCTLFKKSIIS